MCNCIDTHVSHVQWRHQLSANEHLTAQYDHMLYVRERHHQVTHNHVCALTTDYPEHVISATFWHLLHSENRSLRRRAPQQKCLAKPTCPWS